MNARLFRLVWSIIILGCIHFTNFPHKLLVITLIPFVLDSLDCGVWKRFIDSRYDCRTFDYQVHDKFYDLLTYAMVIYMAKKYYDTKVMIILVGTFLWRAIGVIRFALTRDQRGLVTHFDGINSTMVIAYAMTKSEFIKTHQDAFIILGFILKWWFESYMHKDRYL